MKSIETKIKNLLLIEPKVFEDSRGFLWKVITTIKKLGEENETNIRS